MPNKKWYQEHLDNADWEGGLAEYILGYRADFSEDDVLSSLILQFRDIFDQIENRLMERAE